MPSSVQDVDYGSGEYDEELENTRCKLQQEQERSRSLQVQVHALMARLANATGHDARMLDASDGEDSWAHVHDARAYDAPPASEASLLSQASDLEYITRQEHKKDAVLAHTKKELNLLRVRRDQSQADAKDMRKQNDSLNIALQSRGEQLAAYKAECKDLRYLLEDPKGQSELAVRASQKLENFFYAHLGPSAMKRPVLDEVPSFVSHTPGQFMSNEAKAICGVFAMFSTREQTMFFPDEHAARAVIVRSTHKFIKKDESPSGFWERFENRTDFQPGNVRQVFWRTGHLDYKYMGAYRCEFRSEMSLGQVPKFPDFDPHNIIRNAVKQHEHVSPLITSSVESLFKTSAIRVNCWALERIGYNTKLEDALFQALDAPPMSLHQAGSYPTASHVQRHRHASGRAPAPYNKRPRGDDSRRSRANGDEGRSYEQNRYQ